jgi:hypothetical protein
MVLSKAIAVMDASICCASAYADLATIAEDG